MSTLIKYPLDTANFRWIRENGFLYVDKTEYIHKLLERGIYYFLARPRRFGKSLFLDTMAEYFKGNRALFEGLAVDSIEPGEWESYPVLRFNLSKKNYVDSHTLINHLNELLSDLEIDFKLESSTKEYEERFEYLVRRLFEKTGKRVVILIDEYDAPLTSAIGKPELQEAYREQLHGFYSVLKGAEEYIRFCFLTGVTRYGKVSVFSGLNNLNDITFDNRYAGICGITKEELEVYYKEGIRSYAKEQGMSRDEVHDKLKFYYDGYHFSPSLIDIYNPYSINHVFDKGEFRDYWCQSGVPTILSKSLLENDYDIQDLNDCLVDSLSLAHLSVHSSDPIPLLYQTGYLTIKGYEPEEELYSLGYPNREVERGILNNILSVYNPGNRGIGATISRLKKSLKEGKPEEFIKILSSFLSSIPNQLHKKVDRYENYYHTIFYCITTLIGLDVSAEYSTSEGFIDMLIKTEGYIYVIELKVNGTAEDGMRQIEERRYAAPFATDSRQLYKIGIGFSKTTHSIESFLIEG